MSAKTVLTVIGIAMIVQGITFYLYSVPITQNMFPNVKSEAIEVGEIMRQLLGAGSLFIGIILFLARTNVTSAAKRILFGSSIGFSIIVAVLVHVAITHDSVSIPLFPLILFGIFAVISFLFGDSGVGDRRGY